MDDKELSSFRINFPHNLYGDDIFLLDQGYSIYPNFMSWAKPKAMHAYDPGYKEQRGFIILHGKLFENGIRNKVNIADIMPTMLDILKMEIPTVVEGKSLIR